VKSDTRGRSPEWSLSVRTLPANKSSFLLFTVKKLIQATSFNECKDISEHEAFRKSDSNVTVQVSTEAATQAQSNVPSDASQSGMARLPRKTTVCAEEDRDGNERALSIHQVEVLLSQNEEVLWFKTTGDRVEPGGQGCSGRPLLAMNVPARQSLSPVGQAFEGLSEKSSPVRSRFTECCKPSYRTAIPDMAAGEPRTQDSRNVNDFLPHSPYVESIRPTMPACGHAVSSWLIRAVSSWFIHSSLLFTMQSEALSVIERWEAVKAQTDSSIILGSPWSD
jgi:hypothetical protein